MKLRLTTYTHRLKSVSNEQITQAMGYDSTGNVTTTTLSGSGGKTIQTTAAYGGSGNRLTCVTDAAGATVSYSYGNSDSVMRSLPTSVTDPNGIVTTSAYDTSESNANRYCEYRESIVYLHKRKLKCHPENQQQRRQPNL